MRLSWRAIAIFVTIWAVAGLVILWSHLSRATPASITAYIGKNPIESLTPAKRAEVIDKVAAQLNKLNFDQRQELRKAKIDRNLFEEMTPEERKRFLDLTLPEGFRQLMIALNKMEPQRRKKIVQRALDDLEKDRPDGAPRIDQVEVQKMISQGVDTFYSEANADVKLDFAPVIEQLQRATQHMR
jgi:hypothetical protein